MAPSSSLIPTGRWALGAVSAARLRVLTALSATPQVVWVRHERRQDAQLGVSTSTASLYRAGIETQVAPSLCTYEDDLLPKLPVAPSPALTAPWVATIAAIKEDEYEAEAAFLRFLLLF